MSTVVDAPPAGRTTLRLMIPVNLLLVPWVWIGRVVFGVFGWFGLIMVPVALVVAAMLLTTTIIAMTQPTRPRRLTLAERRWQWVLWASLFGLGALLPDFGDTEDSYRSLLTQVFGYSDGLMSLSWTLVTAAALVAVVAWIGLLVSLLHGRRGAAPEQPQQPASSPA